MAETKRFEWALWGSGSVLLLCSSGADSSGFEQARKRMLSATEDLVTNLPVRGAVIESCEYDIKGPRKKVYNYFRPDEFGKWVPDGKKTLLRFDVVLLQFWSWLSLLVVGGIIMIFIFALLWGLGFLP